MAKKTRDLPDIRDPLYAIPSEAPVVSKKATVSSGIDIPDLMEPPEQEQSDPHRDEFDGAVRMAFVGAGQGGGRVAQAFYDLGYRKVCAINCLDSATEALTRRGWVPGFELRRDDVLLTKNPTTGQLEWQEMSDLKLYPDYEGPLVEFKSRSFHAVSTPEHRWLVTQQWDGRVGECTSTSISLTGAHRIHRTGDYRPGQPSGLTPDEAELLGWFVSDGGLRTDRKTPRAFIYQSLEANPDNCERISELLRRLDPEGPKQHLSREETYSTWSLGKRLSELLYSRCPERTLTPAAMLDLDRVALERLREGMLLGDGTCGDKDVLCTGRSDQADAFQMLCTLTGSATGSAWRDMSSYEPKSEKLSNIPKMDGAWYVTVLKRDKVQVVRDQYRQFEGKVPVWCPVVPNTFFVARRSGYVFITGNTTEQDLASLTMPNKLVIGNDRGGAGKDPEQGKLAAKESFEDIMDLLMRSWGESVEQMFVCVGAGGGSGTGSWATLVEACKEFGKSTNIEKPINQKIGVIMTMPKRSEGARVQKNAYIALVQACEMLEANKLSTLIIVDNAKIHELFPNQPVKTFWGTANASFASMFHTFNLLAAQNSEYITFDKADFRSVLRNGILIFGMTRVQKWEGKEDISQAMRQNLKSSLLADGFDLSKANMAGAVIVAHDDILSAVPMENLDYAINSLGRALGNEGITLHSGIYEGRQPGLRVFTIVSGLQPPQKRLQELEAAGA